MEWYVPDTSPWGGASLASRVRAAASGMRAKGIQARLFGFIALPDEETLFCLLEAPSRAVAEELSTAVGRSADRIVDAIHDPGRCADCSDLSG
jgi:hypothetical protein